MCVSLRNNYIIFISPPLWFIFVIRPSGSHFRFYWWKSHFSSSQSLSQCASFSGNTRVLWCAYLCRVCAPASMLCTSLSPAWPSYWCLCCGGHLERCPVAAHEHCPYPSSPYSSVWQGCQPRLLSLPESAKGWNCQCPYTSSAERDTTTLKSLLSLYIIYKDVCWSLLASVYNLRSYSCIYAKNLVALTVSPAKGITFGKQRNRKK